MGDADERKTAGDASFTPYRSNERRHDCFREEEKGQTADVSVTLERRVDTRESDRCARISVCAKE